MRGNNKCGYCEESFHTMIVPPRFSRLYIRGSNSVRKRARMKKHLHFALSILLIAPASIRAADGDLDVNFGTAGRVTTDFELGVLAVQSNGKIVVAGPNHSLC
jgi:hypothetical protein